MKSTVCKCLLQFSIICCSVINTQAQLGITKVRPANMGAPETSLDLASEPSQADASANFQGSPIGALTVGSGINYNGGFVINPVHVYFIWYGNWANNNAPSILPDLIMALDQSPYLNIMTTYWGKTATGPSTSVIKNLTNRVSYGGQAFDFYSHGSHLDDTGAKDVVSTALATFGGGDPFGVYFVLTSADVRQTRGDQEFCIQYCGYHGHTFRNNINLIYSVVGNPDRCPSSCEAQQIGPNGNAGADGMASVIAHEFTEAITDPNGDAWFDFSGNELADKCSWIFGPTFITPNGAQANVTLGTRNFLLQELWVNTGAGFCDLAYFGSPTPPPSGGGGGGGGGGHTCSPTPKGHLPIC
jgi:hypothetical protein